MNGAAPASHSSGAPFARLDSAVVKYTLPANLFGQTLYFKFQSFNIFGSGLESLASCSVYTYTPTGAGGNDPIAAQLLTGIALDLGQVTAAAAVSDDFGSVTAGVIQTVNLGTAP